MPDTEESLSKIAEKISNNSVVLDVGCSSGMMGRYLALNKGCVVDGIDIDKQALENCYPIYRKVVIKNLETDELTDSFAQHSYDFIIVADVMEHLNNPDQLLSQLRMLVKPHGTIIFSVPNITHLAASLELLSGNFSYSQNGLLDNTHIRFYSRKTLIAKFLTSGLYAWEIDAVHKELEETEFHDGVSRLFPKDWLSALIDSRTDSLVYQWIVSTKLYPCLEEQKNNLPLAKNKPVPLFTSLLYWRGEGKEFAESQKIIGIKTKKNAQEYFVDFQFRDIPEDGLAQIRVDPISELKSVWIKNGKIMDSQNTVIWEWQHNGTNSELVNATWINAQVDLGKILSANNDDPQWYPSIPKSVLEKITNNSKLSLIICDNSAIIDKFLIDALDQLIASSSATIANLESQNVALKVYESGQQKIYESAQQELNELRKKCEGLELRVSDMLSSRSWRITAPFRKVGKLFR